MPCFLQKNDPAIGVCRYSVTAHLRLIWALQLFSLQIPPYVLHPSRHRWKHGVLHVQKYIYSLVLLSVLLDRHSLPMFMWLLTAGMLLLESPFLEVSRVRLQLMSVWMPCICRWDQWGYRHARGTAQETVMFKRPCCRCCKDLQEISISC